jgi:hypothetical protein
MPLILSPGIPKIVSHLPIDQALDEDVGGWAQAGNHPLDWTAPVKPTTVAGELRRCDSDGTILHHETLQRRNI